MDTQTAQAPTVSNEELDLQRAKIGKVIEEIRPAVQSDGGDLELVDVDADGIVAIKLHGSCVGCPSSTATLQLHIERYIIEEVPQVRKVICV